MPFLRPPVFFPTAIYFPPILELTSTASCRIFNQGLAGIARVLFSIGTTVRSNFSSMFGPTKPADTLEERAMRLWWPILLCGSLIFFGALVFGLHTWRIAHFPHAVATITDVWDEQIRVSRGRRSFLGDLIFEPKYETITMGRIRFVRTHRGKTYDCSAIVQLGVPSDAYQVGEKLDVVPATGTCQRIDVIGRVD